MTVTAQVLTAGQGVEQQTLTLPITLSPVEGGKVDSRVRKEILLLEAARARDEALEAQRRGDYAGGTETLGRAVRELGTSPFQDGEIAEELRDLGTIQALFEQGVVDAADVKYIKQRAREATRSRHMSKERIRRTRKE
ncbi:MAG: hypothetical protein WD995_12310 [Gemmatimonadota bacterium]